MPSHSLHIDQLVDSSTRLSWHESLALVRSLAVLASSGSPTVQSRGTFEEFSITETGEVAAAVPLPQLSISELALLLARLLPPEQGRGAPDRDERAPAGLHFAIARALGMVQAPTFADMEEFSAALGRFLRQDPAVSLRAVFERCAPRASAENDVAVVNVTAGTAVAAKSEGAAGQTTSSRPAGHGATEEVAERRRTGPRTEVLRRMLRDEDRENYLYLVEQKNRAEAMQRRTTSPTPETLRRLLREADEHNFALKQAIERLMASGSGPRAWRRHLGHLALGVMLLAGVGGVIELEHWQHVAPVSSTRSSATPTRATTTNPAEQDAASQPLAPPSQASPAQVLSDRPEAPVTEPSTTQDPKSSASAPPVVAAPAASSRIASQRVTERAAAARRAGTVDRAGSASRTLARRPTFYDITSGRNADANTSASSTPVTPSTPATSLTTANDSTTKATGPVPRFFSAVYRSFGRLVHRSPDVRLR